MDFSKDKIKDNLAVFYGLIFSSILWLMIWGTYNTDIFRIFSPGFPHNVIDLMHGLRSLLPLVAIILSAIFLFKNRQIKKGFFLTPLGLLSVYVVVGMISSMFSKNPLAAFYWAVLYGSPIIVLAAVIHSSNPLKKLSLIININWLIAGFIALALIAFFLLQPGVSSSLSSKFFICGSRPFEGLGMVPAQANMLDMAGTRPTGLGRYAGLAAIVSFFIFCFNKKKSKLVWLIVFFLFSAILIFSRGRTEIVGFLFAVPIVLLFTRQYKYFLFFWTGLVIFVIGFYMFFQSTCVLPQVIPPVGPIAKVSSQQTAISPSSQVTGASNTAPKANPITFLVKNSNPLTLSGRTNGVWADAWHLFLKNPLLGFGFQADRFFLNGQHAHNSVIHALIQAGILGTVPFLLAFILTLAILIRLFKNPNVGQKERNFLVILSGALLFFFIRSITESVAFFSADWLFVAPIIAYIQCLDAGVKISNNSEKYVNILGNKVNLMKISDVLGKMNYWIKNEPQKLHWVIVTGMHGIVQASKHPDFKYILNSADLFIPDGISLVWLARLKGFDIKKRVSGADLMREFFKIAAKEGFKNYFYGDTNETLQALNKKLLPDFPNLKVAGSYSPPFRELTEEENEEIIEKINNAKPDVLWVALGLPKQEKWIFEHREKLKVPVVIGVGAAFKFLSGQVKRAPSWIGNAGFEWLWRLFHEPETTWKRVFIDIPFFFWLIVKNLFENN